MPKNVSFFPPQQSMGRSNAITAMKLKPQKLNLSEILSVHNIVKFLK